MSIALPSRATHKAPFPYAGGKSRCASIVWSRFGQVRRYVEPFAGSLAVLLARPDPSGIEIVNDADGMIANFWRALKGAPKAVAKHSDWPINECDVHARNAWLLDQRKDLSRRLEGDPEWYDAKIAGWWVWGQSLYMGRGFGPGQNGSWRRIDGRLVKTSKTDGLGVRRMKPNLSTRGGVHSLASSRDLFPALAARLRDVLVASGDWTRVVTPSALGSGRNKAIGVFLDPPYSAAANRAPDIYSSDSQTVAKDVVEWALAKGDDPRLRICVAGYEGEHTFPLTWDCVPWVALGGCGRPNAMFNRFRERLWFSPHCLK